MYSNIDNKQGISERIEEAVCGYLNISTQSLVNQDRKANITLGRGIVMYILHKQYGFSANELAKLYFRTRRAVFWHINKIDYLIKKQKMYMKMYADICEAIK